MGLRTIGPKGWAALWKPNSSSRWASKGVTNGLNRFATLLEYTNSDAASLTWQDAGKLVADGNLIAGTGRLPFNTDGGGLCNNHPANRGGITKVIEAVRQMRGEAHPAVQVKSCDLALAHGTGGSLGTRHGSATVILERE